MTDKKLALHSLKWGQTYLPSFLLDFCFVFSIVPLLALRSNWAIWDKFNIEMTIMSNMHKNSFVQILGSTEYTLS